MTTKWPDSDVLVLRVIGGLGNQLYQYGAGLALAEATGRTLWIDKTADPGQYGPDPRPFLLDALGCPEEVFYPVGWRRALWKLMVGRDQQTLAKASRTVVVGDGDPFEALVSRINDVAGGVALKGYFIEPWAAEKATPSGRTFLARYPLREDASDLNRKIIETGDSVAVHVRRGDYLTTANAPVKRDEFYRKGLEVVRESLPNCKFYVFSDDHRWAREWAEKNGAEAVVLHGQNEPIGDLKLIAACRHFILSDSTFSAWALRLSAVNRESVVISPEGFDRKYGFESSELSNVIR